MVAEFAPQSDLMIARIYLGITLSLLLAGAAALAIYTGSQTLRFPIYQENALKGLMTLIHETAGSYEPERRRQYFEIVSRLLGAEISIESETGPIAVSTSNTHSDLTTKTSGSAIRWTLHYLDGNTEFQFQSLNEQQFRAKALIFAASLQDGRSLDSLRRFSEFPLANVPLNSAELDPQQRSRLRNNSVVVVYPDNKLFSVYVPLNDEQLLKVGPIPQFDPLDTPVIVLMLFVSLFIVTLVSYILVRSLGNQLSQIDAALLDFSAGKFDSRIALTGSSEISALADRIDILMQQVQNLLTSQQHLMQAVSHELRTPMARLKFRLASLENADQSHVITAAEQDLSELESLVDEVLEHQRLLREPELELAEFPIKPMAEDVTLGLEPIYPNIKTSLDAPVDIAAHAHAPSVFRLMHNLVSNAFKHAEAQIEITVSEANGVLRIQVDDDGIGIPESERKKVFDPFYRLDNSRTTKGYGLGLAICARIIELHNGKLYIESSPSGGARFIAELPGADHA